MTSLTPKEMVAALRKSVEESAHLNARRPASKKNVKPQSKSKRTKTSRKARAAAE